uniref:glycosyltransferase family 4 protein n=1 Tax=Roseovarius sp. TaxID=1486281 RepID=UPI0035652480
AYSIERVFADIRAGMPSDVEITERRNTNLSKGLVPRLYDAWMATRRAAKVNHVTGDVHYITYFLPKARTILTIHDTVMVERERGFKRALLWFFWFWLPARRTGWMTAISEETKIRLLSLISFDPERVLVIPNPVSSHFESTPLPLRKGLLRLLHIGTKPNKNLERLLRALQGMQVELTVIGRMTGAQKALISHYDIQCRTLEGLDDIALRNEYARADLIVFVSLDEGFGLPIVEAQASGRPVITSARTPMTEVAGDGALFVDPENAASIRDAIKRLDNDILLCSDLVAKGAENVKRFSAKSVATAYADLYKRVDKDA